MLTVFLLTPPLLPLQSWEYTLLQLILAFAGSGTFAFGRSILSSLTPPHLSAQVSGPVVARQWRGKPVDHQSKFCLPSLAHFVWFGIFVEEVINVENPNSSRLVKKSNKSIELNSVLESLSSLP